MYRAILACFLAFLSFSVGPAQSWVPGTLIRLPSSPASTGFNARVRAMASCGGHLYAGGDFDITLPRGGYMPHVARGDGFQWTILGQAPNDLVLAMTAYDDGGGEDLYVGGMFTVIGSQTAYGVARWSGSGWTLGTQGCPPAPVADFTATPTSGPTPLDVHFTDLSTGSITSWSWSFGDGGTSTLQNPNHTYNVPGTYTVSLTVNGPNGPDTETRWGYVTVSPHLPVTLHVPTQYATIQSAINAAWSADTVLVAPGNYPECIDFLGKAITVRGDQGAGMTTISGVPGCSSLVEFVSGESGSSILEGFTVTNATSGFVMKAIVCTNASPKIRSCVITANASDEAYGVHASDSSLLLETCDISDNFGLPFGFGVRILGPGHAVVRDCVFHNNWGDLGAAVSAELNDVSIEGCDVSGTYSDVGAALSLSGNHAVVRNCRVYDSVPYGILVQGSSEVINCVVRDCIGGMGPGGGISVPGGSPLILNCTVTENDSGYGPGGGFGGLVICGASPQVVNTILWGNFPDQVTVNPPGWNCTISSPTFVNCDIQGGWAGAGVIDVDPMFVDPAANDHHLSSASTCIDAGTATAATLPLTDLDGNQRVQYVTVDIGAYEWSPAPGVGLLASQPAGAGSLELAVGSPTGGDVYFTLLTLNPANAGAGLGTGSVGGLHIDVGELLFQLSLGVPPFYGTLSPVGTATYLVGPGGVTPALSGSTWYGVTHTFDPATLEPTGLSPVIELTLL